MNLQAFLEALGHEIEDVDEETFELFSQAAHLHDLGMIDPKASTLDITIAGRDFSIKQSPGILQSQRENGTTGAVLWRTSVAVAEWIASSDGALVRHGVLDDQATVLELGSGISGVIPQLLAPVVRTVVATDQQHLLKNLRANIESYATALAARPKSSQKQFTDIRTLALDWEEDDVQRTLSSNDLGEGPDVILACDCLYNYALVDPFVQVCTEICRLRRDHNGTGKSTVCVIAQHLRQPDVFEQWLTRALQRFRTWRMPDDLLTDGLKEGSGFAVHICVLR